MNRLYRWLFDGRSFFEKYAAPISCLLALLAVGSVAIGLYQDAKFCEDFQSKLLNMEAHRGVNTLGLQVVDLNSPDEAVTLSETCQRPHKKCFGKMNSAFRQSMMTRLTVCGMLMNLSGVR
jgi:hypothetical protein